MSVPFLSDFEHCAKLRFPEGNNIQFWMDFACWEGIPPDRNFYVKDDKIKEGWVTLVGDGYGVRSNYGNGSMFVRKDDVFGALVGTAGKP